MFNLFTELQAILFPAGRICSEMEKYLGHMLRKLGRDGLNLQANTHEGRITELAGRFWLLLADYAKILELPTPEGNTPEEKSLVRRKKTVANLHNNLIRLYQEKLGQDDFSERMLNCLHQYVRGSMLDEQRKSNPFRIFYHKVQQALANMPADSGVITIEKEKGKGRQYVSVGLHGDLNKCYNSENSPDAALTVPCSADLPTLSELNTKRGINGRALAKLAIYYHDWIAKTLFEGQPCCVAIRDFAYWLATLYPALAPAIQTASDIAPDSSDEPVTLPVETPDPRTRPFRMTLMSEQGQLALAQRLLEMLTAKQRAMIYPILRSVLEEEGTKGEIAAEYGLPQSNLCYHRNRIFSLWQPLLDKLFDIEDPEDWDFFWNFFLKYCQPFSIRRKEEQTGRNL